MEEKSKTIETYRRHEKDTGSADVQVAILTKIFRSLNTLKSIKRISVPAGFVDDGFKRRRLLDYINRVDHKRTFR